MCMSNMNSLVLPTILFYSMPVSISESCISYQRRTFYMFWNFTKPDQFYYQDFTECALNMYGRHIRMELKILSYSILILYIRKITATIKYAKKMYTGKGKYTNTHINLLYFCVNVSLSPKSSGWKCFVNFWHVYIKW